jgi:hypothetical protein
MTEKKLTKLQIETLSLISERKVKETNTGYGSWRILGGSPGVVGKLRTMGLARIEHVDERNNVFVLTESGIQANQPLMPLRELWTDNGVGTAPVDVEVITMTTIQTSDNAIETHGKRPARLSATRSVEVLYVTGRWCSGLPDEHQWDRVTHIRLPVLDKKARAA